MSEPENPPAPPEPQQDDVRRKFREALDRKHGRAGTASHNPAAMHPHTAPAKPRRTFRRKSG